MAQTLTEDLHGVLQSLLGLYGEGQPGAGQAAAVKALEAEMRSHAGAIAVGYSDARGAHNSIAQSHSGKDALVFKTAAESADGTVTGRAHMKDQIADFEARVRAIASVGGTRFSGPALLDAAHITIANATKRVDADVADARQKAARIMPPTVPPPRVGRHSASTRRRRRNRTRSASASRMQHRSAIRSDGTKGSNAVSAASAWLGTPYVWGGGNNLGPSGGGFDCSGLTQYAIAQASHGEVVLPRTTYEQIYSGVRVDPRDVRPGDLVFPGSSFSTRGPEHVQLAAGNGMVIEAPYTGSTVSWSRMSSDAIVVRVL
ncbi:C40 family peptidase [Nocardia sp. NPDC057440]|uniref:C40 family peptidase n=1 Tax=Nocardia sp. NPDC057440 TaxID=3346134 RepID=UPI003671EDB7